jgi:hypothetical protein
MKGAYRLFLAIICLALLAEGNGGTGDPLGDWGWYVHADISSWIPGRIIFSPVEIGLMVLAVVWLARDARLKTAYRFQRGTLLAPVLTLTGLLAFGICNGALQGNQNLTIALWEIRGFLMLTAVYLVSGIYVRTERHLDQIVWTVLIASTWLAAENTLRWLIYLRPAGDFGDLAYDHVDSVVLAFAIVLCLSLFAFGGTRAQRRYAACILPLLSFCLEIMKRRAAFIVVAVGILVLVLILLRLRPRVFWKVVPPLALLCAIYLAVFWHNTSIWGQPARAISSTISPDARDFSSNLYRLIEKSDIVANIQSAPITGIGFGRPYTFYYPLPDLSFWSFWHYTPHNAVLWVWMKDGAIGFIAFWWLLGRAAHDGSKAIEMQREEWSLAAALRKKLGVRLSARGQERLWGKVGQHGNSLLRPIARAKAGAKAHPPFGFNLPMWERVEAQAPKSTGAQPSGALALVVTCVCMVPMQIAYSYVDLGLTSERNLLLFGLSLGLIARAVPLLNIQLDVPRNTRPPRAQRGRTRRDRDAAPTLTPAEAQTVVRELLRLPHVEAPVEEPVHEEPVHEEAALATTDTGAKVDGTTLPRVATLRVPRNASAPLKTSAPLPWERPSS